MPTRDVGAPRVAHARRVLRLQSAELRDSDDFADAVVADAPAADLRRIAERNAKNRRLRDSAYAASLAARAASLALRTRDARCRNGGVRTPRRMARVTRPNARRVRVQRRARAPARLAKDSDEPAPPVGRHLRALARPWRRDR